ncbi:hypothetical protein RBSH_01587 [Rhodopirellula baltica SH28]|uniref:Glycosyl transferase family 2 n=1 Tax=Rhodopirellula baltica SH28 TaxID=993517 RepID=K5DJ66_RHOBT|nr:hypothetical protein RBSH_01587 [Rhodopirellula baltica SH28]
MKLTPIAVLGPYRGGTSAVTGAFRKLGCYAGESFFEARTGYTTHESEYLRRCCLQCFDENEGKWQYLGTFEQRVQVLRRWIIWAARRARAGGYSAIVAKHPSMCMLVHEISAAWNLPMLKPLLFVRVIRREKDVIRSWENALAGDGTRWWPRNDRDQVVRNVIATRDQALKSYFSVDVEFDELRLQPEKCSTDLMFQCGLSQAVQEEKKDVTGVLQAERSRLKCDVDSFRIVRKKVVPPDPATPLVAMVVFNEMLRLPDTLRHYRSLGVERFAIIDNSSTDGTLDYLKYQPDVDIYSTDNRYRQSVGGSGWISALIHRHYGVNRWVLWSDADEQFVFDGFESRSLPELCQLLVSRNRQCVPALMVEMYSKDPVHETELADEQRLLDCCNWFDGIGYQRSQVHISGEETGVKWSGGPGERVFEVDKGWQAKVPLIFWNAETWYWNPHVAYPFFLNTSLPTGALLHFKYLADFSGLVDREVKRNEHAYEALKYRQYHAYLSQTVEASLWCGMSVEYESSRSLIDSGLMTSVRWEGRA